MKAAVLLVDMMVFGHVHSNLGSSKFSGSSVHHSIVSISSS